MALTDNSNTGFYMPVQPAYGGGYGNQGSGFFGGDWAWIILLLLIGGGGWGMGGFGMGGSYRGYSREGRGYSMARGRMNAPRDSRGRYSGADGDVEDIKRDMQRLMDKVEKM